jgi:hypothetical protein
VGVRVASSGGNESSTTTMRGVQRYGHRCPGGETPTGHRVRVVADGGPGLSDLLSLGATLATCLVVGFGLGWLADSLGGTFPVFALVGLALGVVAACLAFYRIFKRYSS